VGETQGFTRREDHEWYWFPQHRPEEIAFLKCYDSINDGDMSRWSFHTSCILPDVPRDAPSRKNIVVRAFVFY